MPQVQAVWVTADPTVHVGGEIQALFFPATHAQAGRDGPAANGAGRGEGGAEVETGAGTAAHGGRVAGGGDRGPFAPISVGEGAFEEVLFQAGVAGVGGHDEEGEDPDPLAHERERHALDAPAFFGHPGSFGIVPERMFVSRLAVFYLFRCPAAQQLYFLVRLVERGAGGAADVTGVFGRHKADDGAGLHRVTLPEAGAN